MSDCVLEVADLVAGYGRQPVLHGLSLRVGADEVLGLIGPNGHGKTTLLRAVSGLIPVWQGSVHFRGEDITLLPTPAIAERGLVHVPQGNHLFPDMTVLENLHLGAYAPGPRANWRSTLERLETTVPILIENTAGGENAMSREIAVRRDSGQASDSWTMRVARVSAAEPQSYPHGHHQSQDGNERAL